MRETLIVILNEREGSATVVRKIGKISFKVMILHFVLLFRFPFFSQGILAKALNDD